LPELAGKNKELLQRRFQQCPRKPFHLVSALTASAVFHHMDMRMTETFFLAQDQVVGARFSKNKGLNGNVSQADAVSVSVRKSQLRQRG